MKRNLQPIAYAAMSSLAALALTGCALSTTTVSSPLAGLSCVDDSLDCIGKRQATLRYLTDDSSRTWVRQKPNALAYASGVRLFAYRKKKSDLSCDELKIGRMEADAAPAILRGSEGASLSPAQVSRGTMLAAEVSRDLRREAKRRCKGKA